MYNAQTPASQNNGFLNPGMILVDMQEHFLGDVSRTDRVALVSSQRATLRACALSDCPVIVLEWSGYSETIPELQPILKKIPRKRIIGKEWNDGFTNSELEDQIRIWEMDPICFAGVSAPFCVQGTAKTAKEKGFQIATARPLIAAQTYRQTEFKDCIPWFKKNGFYAEDHYRIIELMRQNHKTN